MIDLKRELERHELTRHLTMHDWRVPGRGPLEPIGVLNHHTVSNPPAEFPSRQVVTHGRPDVGGPLCNILGGRSGALGFITDGAANHAGRGDPNVLAKIRRGEPAGGRPGPDQDGTNARRYLIGIEWENDGTGEPWSAALLDSMRRVNAALCDIFGWDPLVSVLQHHEWTRRKIDCNFVSPAITPDGFRSQVAAFGTQSPPTPGEWDEMATKDEIRDVVREQVAHGLMLLTGSQFDPAKMTDPGTKVYGTKELRADLAAGMVAVGVQVIQAVGKQQGVVVDPTEVAQAVTDELARRLSD